MTYCPPKNKKAQNLSLLFIITGILLTALGSLLPYGAFFQIAAIVMIVVGIQLLVRFVLSDFRYIIDDRDDGTSELIIYKRQGSRDAKVCHVALSGVIEIFPRSDKKVKSDNRFNYCQNLTDAAQVIHLRDGDKTLEVILEPDEGFLTALRERVGQGELGRVFMM